MVEPTESAAQNQLEQQLNEVMTATSAESGGSSEVEEEKKKLIEE